MPILNYNVEFIDDDFFKNYYNNGRGSAFIDKWNDLVINGTNDAAQQRFIQLASTRIKRLIDEPFVELTDLEQEQGEAVQVATARMIDYWLEYGFDLNRISGSVSLGSFSASQTVASDPDYIPENVYEVLQDANLFTPAGYIREQDLYRAGDDEAITYGVRFKTLERVKNISLDKTDAESDLSHGNQNLEIPTTGKLLEDIRLAKLSPFVIIGTVTDKTGANILPTADELETMFLGGTLIMDNGVKLVSILTGTDNELRPVAGDAIRYKLQSGVQEISNFDGAKWQIDNSKNASLLAINANTEALTKLNGNDHVERAIKEAEGDTRYIKTDGSNSMSSSYTPSSDEDVMTKGLHDADKAGSDAIINKNAIQISLNKTTSENADTLSKTNAGIISTNTTNIEANTKGVATNLSNRTSDKILIDNNVAGVTDYVTNKADFVRLEDITGSVEIDFITPLIFIEDGDDAVADLSNLDPGEVIIIDKFVKNRLITIQATPTASSGFPVEYARDSWNNTTGTANVILGRDITVISTYNTTTKEIRISGLTNPDRTNFIRDFTITSLSQLGGSAGAGIDNIARTAATAAQATAAQAATTANSASAEVKVNTDDIAKNVVNINSVDAKVNAANVVITKHTTDIATNDNSIRLKQNSAIPGSTTTAKDVEGAIKELDARSKNNEADTAELNKGKFDVNGDGTQVVEIFDANGDLDQTIKDLTHLTTQDEIFNAMNPHPNIEQNIGYIVKIDNSAYVVNSQILRSPSLVEFNVTNVASGVVSQNVIVCKKGDTSKPLVVIPRLKTGTSVNGTDAVNKQSMEFYVDNKINTDMLVTFDDGTTGTYKLGK